MLQVRLYAEDDYQMVSDWWGKHNWACVPPEILPKIGGVIYEKETGLNLTAAWLYMDNSTTVSWMEWFVSNPEATGFQVIKAHKLLLDFLERCAMDNDYGIMLTTCRQPSLSRLYEKNGFVKTDESVIHLLKVLKAGGEA